MTLFVRYNAKKVGKETTRETDGEILEAIRQRRKEYAAQLRASKVGIEFRYNYDVYQMHMQRLQGTRTRDRSNKKGPYDGLVRRGCRIDDEEETLDIN